MEAVRALRKGSVSISACSSGTSWEKDGGFTLVELLEKILLDFVNSMSDMSIDGWILIV